MQHFDSEPEYVSDFEVSYDSPVRPQSRHVISGFGGRSSRGAGSSNRGATDTGIPHIDPQEFGEIGAYFSGTALDSPLYESDDFLEEIEEPAQENKSLHENEEANYYEDEFYNSRTPSPEHEHPDNRVEDELQQPTIITEDGPQLAEFSSVTFAGEESIVTAPDGSNPSKKQSKRKISSSKERLKSHNAKAGVSSSKSNQPALIRRPAASSADSFKRPGRGVGKLPPKDGNRSFSIDYNSHHVMDKVDVKSSIAEKSGISSMQRPVVSSLAEAMQHSPGELYRQLTVLNKKYEACKRENHILRSQLDANKYKETVEKFTMELSQKDDRILALEQENASLRQIVRYQERELSNKESVKQHEYEFPSSSEKALEVILEQVKKLKAKNLEQRQAITDYEDLNGQLKEQVDRLRKKNASLRKFKDKVIMEKLRVTDQPTTAPAAVEPIAVEHPENGSAKVENSDCEKWMAMEKAYQTQISVLQREIAGLKLSTSDYSSGQKRMQMELDKRESFIKVQIFNMKNLKKKYEDLLEGNRQLTKAAALLMRDRTVKPPPAPPAQPILPPHEGLPVPVPPPTKADAPKGAMLVDDDDNHDVVDTYTSDMTFLTNHDMS